jgi:hypothetical protein
LIIIVAVSASDRRGSSVIAWRVISSCRCSADGSSANTYRHSTAYGRAAVNAAAIDTSVMNTNAAYANASSVCEGVS